MADWNRRESCLKDPEKFLRTYFAARYRRPFNRVHHEMMHAIIQVAKYGGRQSIAAPRGIGKSELVKGMLPYLALALLVRFPLPVASTTPHAGKLYADFQKKFAQNELLHADFPEVCAPVRALEGAPQRAARQHVDGKLTNIVWSKSDYLSFPEIEGSPYGGIKMAYYGLDAAFRGLNIDSDRPDFVLIDDPETRESAKSEGQIDDRELILDQDIAGLAEDGADLGIVVLTTIQNSFCLSARLTDPTCKAAWGGKRYGTIVQWPTHRDLWDEYIALRHTSQAEGDRHGLKACAFYLANREKMDEGHEMLSDYFVPKMVHVSDLGEGYELPEGVKMDKRTGTVPVTFSPLQAAFNKIADTSLDSFKTEYQNDPVQAEEVERIRLTVGRVIKQTGGLERGEQTDDIWRTTMGLDIGKYTSHWCKTAWTRECVGWLPDYGFESTIGMHKHSSDKAIGTAIIDMMEQFAESEAMTKNPPLLVLVDSGDYTDAVYEACKRLGPPFFPSKGHNLERFKMPKETNEDIANFWECYAKKQEYDREWIWLYHVNGEFWKNWAQELFLVDPFNDDRVRVPGSIAMFEPPEGDAYFHKWWGRTMVSECEEWLPIPNRPSKRVWAVKDRRNNHGLDAISLSCCAAGAVGVRLNRKKKANPIPEQPKRPAPPRRAPPLLTNNYGQPYFVTER